MLPRELEVLSVGFVERVAGLLGGLDARNITDGRDLALLDLKMIESGIVHSGLTPPARLVEIVDQLAGTEVPGLTYEDVVLVNPAYEMRAFTRGEVRETEIGFYNTHRMIEEHLERAIQKMRKAIGHGHFIDVLATVQALQGINEDLDPVVTACLSLGDMAPGHFERFRKYLGVHPIRKTRGPSANFSASVPLLETLLRGDELSPMYLAQLAGKMEYLPRDGRRVLKEILRLPGSSLVSLWRGSGKDPLFRDRINEIGLFTNQFRDAHYRAAAKQIPEAMRDKLAGTGGVDHPGTYLRKMREDTKFTPVE
jgi:hypothetical protein